MKAAACGFTLLEVVISLTILSIGLVILLQAQTSNLMNANRSRDMTIVTLLARSKMIDIEQKLFHDGFVLDNQELEGHFEDEGHPEASWHARISEISIDLSALSAMYDHSSNSNSTSDSSGLLDSLGPSLGMFTDQLAQSLRVIDLEVHLPSGKHQESAVVRALVTNDTAALQQQNNATRDINDALGGASNAENALKPQIPSYPARSMQH